MDSAERPVIDEGDECADLGDEVVAAEGTLAEDGGGLLFKALALGGVEVHGGDDEDGGGGAGFGGAVDVV